MTRKTFLFLLLVPFLCAAAAIASAEVTIKISSHCDHFAVCETGKSLLEKELMLTAGVKAVSIDSQLMTVTVKYNPRRTNPDKIRKVISKTGYNADDVKADPKGQEKLDDCCRK